MFRRHKLATAVGAVGAALVLAHVVLGPAVVPVRGAFAGLILVVVAAFYAVIADRLGSASDLTVGRRR
jgi:drug/metabolite transporter (DMT)-like permease